MSETNKRSSLIIAAILGGSLLAPAIAAAAPAMPRLGAAAQPAQVQQVQQRSAQRPPSIDQMLHELRQRLRLTAAQMPAFNAFAGVMHENARQAQRLRPPNRNADAVQMLRTELAFTEAEVRGLRRMLPALQGLYAVLSPAQRRTADGFFRQGPGRR